MRPTRRAIRVSKTFTITVKRGLGLPDPSDRTFTEDKAVTPYALPEASGGTPGYTYSASGLPPGLTFNASNREVSGTPTSVGSWTVTYSATDSATDTASKTFTITVKRGLGLPDPSDRTFTEDKAVTPYALPEASGGTPGYTYNVSGLPPGLTFNASNREVSGTPTSVGSWTVTYSATDSATDTASKTFTITVAAPDPPSAPSGVGKVESDRTLRFTWGESTGAMSYSGELTRDTHIDAGSCSTTSAVRTCTFNDLTNGTTYSFRVRATREGLDSAYSSPETATPEEPEVTLTGWEGSVSAGESNDFTIRISGLSPTRHYEVILDRENAGTAFGFAEDCSTDHQNQVVPDGSSAIGTGYTLYACSPTPLVDFDPNSDDESAAVFILGDTGLQSRPCGTESLLDCEWRRLSSREMVVTPSIDVEPRPLRMARLSWQPVPNADTYRVEHQKSGGSGSIYVKMTAVPEIDIALDSVLVSGEGLAHSPYSYDFRVKAQDSVGLYLDGEVSDTITIMDNPLLLTGGSAKYNDAGEAELEWSSIPDVGSYTVRYRQLGSWFEERGRRRFERDHTHIAWPNHEEWPHYDEDFVELPSTTASSETVTNLDEAEIYAFQLNYTTTSGQKVFSARDAYVWASDRLPERTSRVGTYPFFGYWENGSYGYTICADTFTPAESRGDWMYLIEHAFEQWEQAAPDFITVTREYGDCLSEDGSPIDNDVPITVVEALFNESNEVYMVDMSGWDRPLAIINDNNLLFHCIRYGVACVISPRYWDLTWLVNPFRPSVRALDEGSVDVLVNATIKAVPENGATFDSNKHRRLDIPGEDMTLDSKDTPFNVCIPGTGDVDFRNYRHLIHEAGHALGLSNFDYLEFWASYTAHPSIPDSVLNYDSEVAQISDEPDCSPHPFDVMAITSLYQTR